ncbi:MAG: L,D-transpeptidase family protein, partial [Kiritimatiellae bacterium]|nr:L,D-transpeptidase family protein [Kiritimatiellia bacterium]
AAAPGPPAAAEPAPAPVPATDAPRAGTLSEADFKKALADAAESEKTGKLYDARDALLAALDKAGDDYAPALEQVLGRLATDIYFSPRPGPDKVVYAVREGDSLARLADRYVCPVALIMRANKVKEAKRIQPGQTLVFPDHPKFAVTVSKSKNTLLLTLNGKFFKRYAVGTGANAKTPAGTWKMVDREEHPGWWKDGRMIPYGDPENILGTHWLALEPTGDTPRVSGYGIHGTWDNTSIGKQSSAGCVRMRNEDVEELYVLLPRGTPVLIVE